MTSKVFSRSVMLMLSYNFDNKDCSDMITINIGDDSVVVNIVIFTTSGELHRQIFSLVLSF